MIKRSLLLSLLAAGSVAAQAQTIPEKVKPYVETCAACHGAFGNLTKGIETDEQGNVKIVDNVLVAPEEAPQPKLAGQHADYLYKQMRDFRMEGDKPPVRENANMNAMIAVVPDEDLRAVADYFAAQKLQPAAATNAETVAIGQKLWRAGDAARGIPACAGCHGPAGKGIPAQYPALAGQFPEYIAVQLRAFRDDVRQNDPANMMRAIALRLTEPQIKAVSDYAAGLR
ncbi:MAG: c-type cytochrome [Azoarcus sp.]|nr:c-type cytochrome [Azoarcus sp.]